MESRNGQVDKNLEANFEYIRQHPERFSQFN